MPQLKLIYFPAMGRAEPIRLTLAQAGVPYDDHRVTFQEFAPIKSQMPMGSVPVLEIDGKTKICQASAICGYLGSVYNLGGNNAVETAKCYMYAGGCEDFWVSLGKSGIGPFASEKDPEKKKKLFEAAFESLLNPFFTRFDKFLAENGTGYLVGNSVTWADLSVYHVSGFALQLCKDNGKECDCDYPNLRKFREKIGNLPKIKEWIEKRPKTPF